MQKKQKILMIPSWYTNKAGEGGGSFFTNQALLYQERYDVRVLYGYSPYMEHKSLYGRYKRYMTRERYGSKVSSIQDPLPTIRFDFGHWWMREHDLINAAIKGYRRELRNLIDEGWRPDLLHAQCAELAGIITARLSEEFGIPWVLTEHQVFAIANYSEYRQRLMKNALKYPKTIAVVSQHQMRCMAIHNIDRPMVVVGNLVDENVFQLAQPRKNPKPFRILTVMWPSKIKDPQTFFQALAVMVQKGHTDIEAIVIGKKLNSEADTSEFRRLAEKYQVREYCQLIPHVTPAEMPRFYADADVYVSTSIAETFGLAVREAMAVGRPVVCTASGGVDDDIFDFNGFKVDIHDYEAVADALIKIKTCAAKFDPIRMRDYVVSKYGHDAFLQKMSIIFNESIGL
jgi:glycosyltransferase involved in cell wall biosynthesis